MVAALIGIALIDSVNPSLFIAQFYLFTTPRPVPRLLVYVLGILTVNFLGGVLVLSGLNVVIGELVMTLSPSGRHALQFGLGAAILAFGLFMRLQLSEPVKVQKPRSLGLMSAFLLGAVVMINELTTALPYFVALERIADARLSSLQSLLSLLLYNVVFGLPLFGFIGLYVKARERFTAQIDRISRVIQYWAPRLIKYGSILLGAALLLDAGLYFLWDVSLF
ncbi:MAG: hypothetical protein OHK0046_46950 [Anaerolineae bacterium]